MKKAKLWEQRLWGQIHESVPLKKEVEERSQYISFLISKGKGLERLVKALLTEDTGLFPAPTWLTTTHNPSDCLLTSRHRTLTW